jgi:uncharacterized protein YbjT (DUF2867 family)
VIAVIGSSGLLGTRVVERLTAKGHEVLAASRKERSDLPIGATSAFVDLRKAESIRAVLKDADAVVVAAHGLRPPGWRNGPSQVDDLGVAAVAETVAGTDTHVTFLSVLDPSIDHDLEFWRAKRKGEMHLEQSGVPIAVLRCSAFMEIHALEMLAKPLKNGKRATVIGRGNSVRNMVSVDDVAALVVWTVENRYTGRLEVVGPDNATPNEDIVAIAEVLGAEPRVMRISPGFARFLSLVPGKLVPNVGRIIEISLHHDARNQPRSPTDLPDGAPVPSRTLTEVVRDNLFAEND